MNEDDDSGIERKWFDCEIILFNGTKYDNLLDVPVDEYDKVSEVSWTYTFIEAQNIFCKFINMKCIQFDTRNHEHDYFELAKTEFIDEIANLQSLEDICFWHGMPLGCDEEDYEITYVMNDKILMINKINFDKITKNIKYVNMIHPNEMTDFTKLPHSVEYLHVTGIHEHFDFSQISPRLKKLTLS